MLLFIALFARYTVLDSIFFKVVFLSLHLFVLMFAVLSLAVLSSGTDGRLHAYRYSVTTRMTPALG